jgi:hypothetical protein
MRIFLYQCLEIGAIMLAVTTPLFGKHLKFQDSPLMSIQKLSGGVLRVLTPLGPRYLRPSLAQRIYLLWIFRNFPTLPVKVLTSRQIRVIDAICAERKSLGTLGEDFPLLGTLEERPAIVADELPPRRPSGKVSDVASFASNLRQRF